MRRLLQRSFEPNIKKQVYKLRGHRKKNRRLFIDIDRKRAGIGG